MRSLLIFILAIPLTAATYTVCTSGCTHTNVNAAITAATCGDTINVKAGGGAYAGDAGAGVPAGSHCGGDGNCSANNPVHLMYKACSGSPITIQTDQYAKLPNGRVLPSYADGATPVLAYIYNPGPGTLLYTDLGNGAGHGAHDYILRGLAFGANAHFSDFVAIGWAQGPGQSYSQLVTLSDLPSNILLDRVIVRTDPAGATTRSMVFDSNGGGLLNSWIEGSGNPAQTDYTAVSSFCGQNLRYINTYFAGVTEVVAYGGTPCPIADYTEWSTSGIQPTNNELAYSYSTHPHWAKVEAWTANTYVPRGKFIRTASWTPFTSAANTWYAAANGKTGATEPTWKTDGTDTTDGAVTWKLASWTYSVKNNLETKCSKGIYIHHNFLDRVHGWQGDQSYGLTLNARDSNSCNNYAEMSNARVEHNWFDRLGNTIQVAGNQDYDNNMWASLLATGGPWNLTSANNTLTLAVTNATTPSQAPVTITLPTGSAVTATAIAPAINAALYGAGMSGIACGVNGNSPWSTDQRVMIRAVGQGYGATSSCNDAQVNQPEAIASTIQASGTATVPLNLETNMKYSGYDPALKQYRRGGFIYDVNIAHNLFTNINTPAYPAWKTYAGAFYSYPNNFQWRHNTSDILYGTSWLGNSWIALYQEVAAGALFASSGGTIRDNFYSLTNNSGGHTIDPSSQSFASCVACSGQIYDFAAVNFSLCNIANATGQNRYDPNAVCPAGVFSRNVIPGATANTVAGPDGTTRTRTTNVTQTGHGGTYPSDNYFTYPAVNTNLEITATALQGAGTDFRTPGADQSELAKIINPQIQVSDKYAVLSYRVSNPVIQSGYACSLRLSTQDLDRTFAPSVVADLDPSLYTTPESDAADIYPQSDNLRYIVLGLRSRLTPSTTYYYELHCPGAISRGSFTTLATPSGATSVGIGERPQSSIGNIATMALDYGTAYSRTTNTISGGAAITTPCSAGTWCSAANTALTSGVPVYIRIRYLDSLGTTLWTGPVEPAIP